MYCPSDKVLVLFFLELVLTENDELTSLDVLFILLSALGDALAVCRDNYLFTKDFRQSKKIELPSYSFITANISLHNFYHLEFF